MYSSFLFLNCEWTNGLCLRFWGDTIYAYSPLILYAFMNSLLHTDIYTDNLLAPVFENAVADLRLCGVSLIVAVVCEAAALRGTVSNMRFVMHDP